jgi:hypothetical protein
VIKVADYVVLEECLIRFGILSNGRIRRRLELMIENEISLVGKI